MRKLFLLLILVAMSVWGAESKLDWNFSWGISSGLQSFNLKDENSQTYRKELIWSTLQGEFTYRQKLTFGVGIGYNGFKLKEHIDFVKLPLSLRLGDDRFSGLLLQSWISYAIFEYNYFQFGLSGQINYSPFASKTYALELASIKGSSTIKESLLLANFELTTFYQGFSGLTPFAGVGLQFISNRYRVSEELGELSGEEIMLLKAKSLLKITAGLEAELGDHFLANLKGFLGSSKGLTLTIKYEF